MASVPLETVESVWARVCARHLGPPALRVRPRNPWPLTGPGKPTAAHSARVPPLLKGYLRLGAWVCGPPALDADFGVADLFVLLDIAKVDPRYIKFFLGEQG